MGTRNLTYVIRNGKYVVAQYCQWDGYVEGQGATILEFLRDKMKRGKFITQLEKCRSGTQEEIHQLWKDQGADDSGMISFDVSDRFKKAHPQLSRDMGGDVLEFIQNADGEVLLYLDLEFAKDGLFCEFVYVIDLDNDKLEVYGGYNEREIPVTSKFAIDMAVAKDADGDGTFTANVVYDLAKLPTQEQFEKDMAEPDENQLDSDGVSCALQSLREKHPIDEEIVNHICNYIEANMDDFLEAVNVE